MLTSISPAAETFYNIAFPRFAHVCTDAAPVRKTLARKHIWRCEVSLLEGHQNGVYGRYTPEAIAPRYQTEMVAPVGLEPTRPFGPQILSLCLMAMSGHADSNQGSQSLDFWTFFPCQTVSGHV